MTCLLLMALFAFPAQAQPATSAKYPLPAHIVSVDTEQKQHLTNGNGETTSSQVVKAEIEGKTYRLSVKRSLFEKRSTDESTWLHTGIYPARRTKHGFEFEYMDGDKLRHEELTIVAGQ